jgi:hypothetical protein
VRRPKRLPFAGAPFQPFSATDEFGLPVLSLLGEVRETPEKRTKRVRFVRRAAFRFYRRIVEHLGEDAAAKLFECFSKGVKGRPSGSADPVRDGELWTAYQAFLKLTREEDQAALPRLLAQSLYEERGRYFGNSAAAIEKRLRRLMKQQQDRRGRIKAAKKGLEAARRRPLTEPWPGTKSVTVKAGPTEPDTKSRE